MGIVDSPKIHNRVGNKISNTSQSWFPVCEEGLKSDDRAVGYYQHVLATASTLGESCHGDLYMVYRHHRCTGLLLPSSGSEHGVSGSINDVDQGGVHLF